MNGPMKRRKSLAEREKYIEFFENFLKYRNASLLREIKSLYSISTKPRRVGFSKEHMNDNFNIKKPKKTNTSLLTILNEKPSTSYALSSTDFYSDSKEHEPKNNKCMLNINNLLEISSLQPAEDVEQIFFNENLHAPPKKNTPETKNVYQQKTAENKMHVIPEMAIFRSEMDRHKQQSNEQFNKATSSKETITSSSSNDKHFIPTNKYWIYVGGLDGRISERHVLQHLRTKFPLYNDFECMKLNSKDPFANFKVGLNEVLKYEIFLPNYWPPGTKIKHFKNN